MYKWVYFMQKYLSAFLFILLTICLSTTDHARASDEETESFLRAVQGVIPGFLVESPTTFDETSIFPDDAPIPLPRRYEPLVELLRFLQTPGLSFGDAKGRIEEMSPLIQEISGQNHETWPPLFHIFMRYAKTFSEERLRLGGAHRGEDCFMQGQESRCKFFFQDEEREPYFTLDDHHYILDAPYRIFSGLYLFRASEGTPLPGHLRLGIHKLFFIRYFSALLYELDDLYKGYMLDIGVQGSAYPSRCWTMDASVIVLTEGDFPRPFKDVFNSVGRQISSYKSRMFYTDWNIFHHVNAMLPHIVYVDY
jgi:hypothetical protein